MQNQFSRTQILLGEKAMQRLDKSRVAVFGIGGVGGHAAEALVRSGLGAIDIIDNDTVSLSNINRQLFATLDTVGEYKVDVAEKRLKQINAAVKVKAYKTFYMPDTSDMFDFAEYDYIIDAIDTVTGKLEIIVNADKAGTPVISSMGAGNKLDPTAFEVSDIYKTSVCPLARVIRYELKKRNIQSLKVVYSKEKPLTPLSCEADNESRRRQIPGSTAFVPSVAGLIIAGEVIKDLTKVRNNR